jgi:hypothetical protein
VLAREPTFESRSFLLLLLGNRLKIDSARRAFSLISRAVKAVWEINPYLAPFKRKCGQGRAKKGNPEEKRYELANAVCRKTR